MRNQTIIGTLTLAAVLSLSACDKNESQPPLTGPTRVAPEQPQGAAPTGTDQLPPGHPPVAANAPAPAAPTDAAALSPEVVAMGVSVTLPQGWQRNPPANAMRIAEALVADASNDPAKACLLVFSSAGGSVEENVTRWSGQVRDAQGIPVPPKSETKTVNGLPVTVVEMTGTFSGMGTEGVRQDWTLRGAIVSTPQGLLFMKMTGPAANMAAQAGAFNQLVDSLKKS